jgi:ribonuclease H2 subunit A
LDAGVNVKELYVDTVGLPQTYQDKLSKIFPGMKIQVAKKADSLFPIVSAASICAKVTRDVELMTWQFKEEECGIEIGKKLGSGYPGDEITKTWLKEHFDPVFGFPSIVRYSWQTVKTMFEESGVKVIWGDEDIEGADPTAEDESSTSAPVKKPSKQMKLGSFFEKKSNSNKKTLIPLKSRTYYFRERNLNVVTNISKKGL